MTPPATEPVPGQRLLRHSTKYDGSLHYTGETQVVARLGAMLATYTPPNVRMVSYRGQHLTRYHSLECYWDDSWYNLTVLWHTDWKPRMHYVNVATPATWHDGTLRYVDLDLDIIWRADAPHAVIDDEDEFLEHQQRFAYPPDLIRQARDVCAAVVAYFAGSVPPFDGRLYTWRPHGSSIPPFDHPPVAAR